MAIVCTMLLAGVYSWEAEGQFKKQFFVEDSDEFEKVDLDLKFNSGTCMLKSTNNPGVFHLYSRHSSEHFSHAYNKEIEDNTCKLSLELSEKNQAGVSKSISSSFFGARGYSEEGYYKVFLTSGKEYDLHFDYGVGNATLDLSELAIRKMQIHTGSADVNVGYFADGKNKISMDTFLIKVDLGNVNVKKLNHAKSSFVMADVGFGNLYLDLSDQPEKSSFIKGKVGAGTLYIALPANQYPVKVKVKNNWLCSINIPSTLRKVSENTYVNDAYLKSSEGAMEFDLDVSMGSLIFKQR